jgi:hypothetical protein
MVDPGHRCSGVRRPTGKELAALWQESGATGLVVVPVDGKYGSHHFLGPLRDFARVAIVTRLRENRVLYGPPNLQREGSPSRTRRTLCLQGRKDMACV